MRPIQHPSSNGVLGAPAGVPIEECRPLFITRVVHTATRQQGVYSYWQPDAQQMALLAAGRPVRLSALGRTHPPVALGVDGDGLDADLLGLGMTQARLQWLADCLAVACQEAGYVLTVEQAPLRPLAMGHYETLCSVRPARGRGTP